MLSSKRPVFRTRHLASNNTREYVMDSNAALFGSVDILFLCLVGTAAFTWQSKMVWLTGVVLCLYWTRSKFGIVKEESMLVVRDIGIQVKTTYVTGGTVSRFIDKSKIAEVIINEGFTMQQIKFYLAVIVEGQDRMVVVFEHLLPRLDVLLQVYRGTRAIMFGEPETDATDAG